MNSKERKCKICDETSMRTRSKRIKLSCDDDEEDNDFGFSKEAISRYEMEMNKVDEYGRTLIHTAVAQTDVRLVKLLLSRGADPLIKDKENKSLLWFAVQSGCVHVAQVLIDHGVDIRKLPYDDTHFAVAIGNKDFNMARLLLRNGVDMKVHLNYFSTSLLLEAIINGNAETVEFLLANGAFVDEIYDPVGGRNETLLFMAVRDNRYKIVTLLIKYGANVHHKNKDSESIVHTAVSNLQNAQILHHLVKKGADVNAVTIKNETPLHYAAKMNIKRIDDLVKCGAEVNVKNSEGWTPLHMAVESKNEYNVQRLLYAGADSDVAGNGGYTPLGIALGYQDKHIIRPLLIAGADPKPLFNKETYARLTPTIKWVVAEFLIAKRAAGFDVDDRLFAKIEMDVKLKKLQEKCLKEVASMEKCSYKIVTKGLSLLNFLLSNSRRLAFYQFYRPKTMNFLFERFYKRYPIYRDMLKQKFMTVTTHLPVLEKAIDSLNVLLRQRFPTEVLEKIIDKLDVDNLKKVIKANN